MANPARFTVHADSRFPQRDRDYSASAHSYMPAYLNPTYRLHLDANPGTEIIAIIPPDAGQAPGAPGPGGAPPGGFNPFGDNIPDRPHRDGGPLKPIKIEKLKIPDDAVSYEWHISGPHGFEKRVSTTIHRQGTAATGKPYLLTLEVPGPGIYNINLRLRLKGGGGPTHGVRFHLRDFLIVSIGDSYASGEGNPDVPGEPEGFDPDLDWWDVFNPAKVLFKLSEEAVEWGLDQLKKQFTTLSRAANAHIEMNPAPQWLEERAHRSLRGGPARAARRLENLREGIIVTFLSFARSGSEVEAGLLGPRTSDGHSIDGWAGHRGQIKELRDTLGNRRIDALLISIGGNDVGFSGRLKDLVKDDSLAPLLEVGSDAKVREKVRKRVNADLKRLPDRLQKLAAALAPLNIGQVYLTEYPTGFFDQIKGGKVVVKGGCGILASDFFDADIDGQDAALMKEAAGRLNEVLQREAVAHKWIFVDGVADGFAGHGYCAGKEGMFIGAEESLVLQGDTDGTMHPNADGHAVYARQIEDALQRHLVEGRPIFSGGGAVVQAKSKGKMKAKIEETGK